MSYSIDFHFGQVSVTADKALAIADTLLQRVGFSFLHTCDELFIDEECGVDTNLDRSLEENKVSSVEQGEKLGEKWIGRAHYYRFESDFDLAVYAWTDKKTAFVASMAFGEWKQLIDRKQVSWIAKILCDLSKGLGAPFGISIINSDFFPTDESALVKALDWITSSQDAPFLIWVAESHIPKADFLSIAGEYRDILNLPNHYSVAISPTASN